MRRAPWVLLLGLILGCGGDKDDDTAQPGGTAEADADTDTDTDSDTDVDTDTDFDGSLIITSPDDGDVIDGGTIPIEFSVEGCVVGSTSAAPDGCHLHKYVDGVAYEDPVEGGGFGHYETNGFNILVGTNGSHEVSLILIRNDGSDQPFHPTITDSVTVTITGLPEDTGGGDTGSSGSDTGEDASDTGTPSSDTGGGSDTAESSSDTGSSSSGTTGGDDTGAHTGDPTSE